MSAAVSLYTTVDESRGQERANRERRVQSGASTATFDELFWNRVSERILEISNLKDDWDGAGAIGVPDEIVNTAWMLFTYLRHAGGGPPDRIVPGPDGSILFEWQYGNVYLEADIERPWVVEWMRKVGRTPGVHSELCFTPGSPDTVEGILWSVEGIASIDYDAE
jgi:hypothetical protein